MYDYYKKNGYVLLISIIFIFFMLCLLFNKKKGTWSSVYLYELPRNKNMYNTRNNTHKKQPKDSKGEIECRRCMEEIFRKPFNKHRPDFLRNSVTGGNNLELDCYNSDLKIAVEYNGIQHYKYVPFFHKNKEAFYNQKYRDELKRRMCKDNGIFLIEVPYTINVNDIKNYLLTSLSDRYL